MSHFNLEAPSETALDSQDQSRLNLVDMIDPEEIEKQFPDCKISYDPLKIDCAKTGELEIPPVFPENDTIGRESDCDEEPQEISDDEIYKRLFM